MKIFHILKTNSFSGAENVAISIIEQINNNKQNNISCIYVALKGPIKEILDEKKIPYI